jgi:DtxR family Mn-dependent transcriptional regulator
MGSERLEEYLEAICKRQKIETPVSISGLAADLGVSLSAVTDMMRRLESMGFIKYQPNRGVSLTSEGNQVAISVIRRHRLWERFLTDILGVKWDKVHSEACRLEHATSPETEKRLASLLGETDTCPHGHPIPDKDGHVIDEKIRPLSDFGPQQNVCIAAVAKEEPRLLRKIGKQRLKPDTVVFIERKDSDGSMELKLDEQRLVLEKDIVDCLLARPLSLEEEMMGEEAPISRLRTNESGVFKSYTGESGMLGRCLSMGFTPGSLVRMVENFGSGPVLVKIHDTEVALDRVIASKMIVMRKSKR